jgi:hypothetical protein
LCAGVGFFLNDTLINNGSIISLNSVGEGSSALYCLTNRTLCCGANTGGADRGIWRFSNDYNLREGAHADIYFTRGFSAILLNRRSNAVGLTGVYTCLIPDAQNTLRTLKIGLYGDGGCKFGNGQNLPNFCFHFMPQLSPPLETECMNLAKPLRSDVPLNFLSSPSSG